jgi:hypothetical protein
MKATLGALREALSTSEPGPKVLIAAGECSAQPAAPHRAAVAATDREAGKRTVRQKFGVDEDVCTGDKSCIRLSGCPSLTIKPSSDPLRTDPVVARRRELRRLRRLRRGGACRRAVSVLLSRRRDHESDSPRPLARAGCVQRVIGWLAGRPELRWTEAATSDAHDRSAGRAGRRCRRGLADRCRSP